MANSSYQIAMKSGPSQPEPTMPPVTLETATTPNGAQTWSGIARGFLRPFGVRDFAGLFPRASLRDSRKDCRNFGRASEPLFGSDNGKRIFESIFATLETKTAAKAA